MNESILQQKRSAPALRNEMETHFLSIPENEAFARVVVAAFAVQLSPTVSEVADLKTAVSEAVTNAIVHGYEGVTGVVTLRCRSDIRGVITIEVEDKGCGIPDVEKAMEPFYTTRPDQERSGMGFSVMQTFMDQLDVTSLPGQGTLVRMKKRIRGCVES
ncbi:MAG: anti-sigma F factor [Clostridiales bacterium]|nr:anti-sigma F factor [Clostridiales bacterium]